MGQPSNTSARGNQEPQPAVRPVSTVVKMPCRLPPTACTAATITIERPPAMMAYSMEVAPLSFATNRKTRLNILYALGFRQLGSDKGPGSNHHEPAPRA